MTVSSTTIKTSLYSCDGATTQFSFSWAIWANTELTVILRTVADGSEEELTLTTDYTVTLSSATPSAGYITTVETYSSSYQIRILANFPLTQEVDYPAGDPFPAASHEEALDRGVRLSQQLQEKFSRTILFPKTTELEDVELPEISSSEASFFLGVNNAGTGLAWGEPTDLGNLTNHDTGDRYTVHQNLMASLHADTSTASAGLGVVASAAEVAAGTESTKIVSPSGLASLIASLVANTNTASYGFAIVAAAQEVADGTESTKIVSPSGLAAIWAYDTVQVPAGALRPAVTNVGTQNTQEYPTNFVTRDYVEFGGSTESGDESVAYDVTLWLPDTWDYATLKVKASWMATYDAALTAASAIELGFQVKELNTGSAVDTNWSTPPVYISDVVSNVATDTEEVTIASANIASATSSSNEGTRLDVRITRRNTGSNSEVNAIWVTQLLFQYRRNNQASGW